LTRAGTAVEAAALEQLAVRLQRVAAALRGGRVGAARDERLRRKVEFGGECRAIVARNTGEETGALGETTSWLEVGSRPLARAAGSATSTSPLATAARTAMRTVGV
jgi:hypothetical protein